jgi:hypothetical protein
MNGYPGDVRSVHDRFTAVLARVDLALAAPATNGHAPPPKPCARCETAPRAPGRSYCRGCLREDSRRAQARRTVGTPPRPPRLRAVADRPCAQCQENPCGRSGSDIYSYCRACLRRRRAEARARQVTPPRPRTAPPPSNGHDAVGGADSVSPPRPSMGWPRLKPCLKCDKLRWSLAPGDRLCRWCRRVNALPDMTGGVGQARVRPGVKEWLHV